MTRPASNLSEANQTCTDYMERSAALLDSVYFSDCSFLVGPPGSDPDLIPGCKLILALTSPVFQAMFYGSLAERNDPMTIPDVNPAHFKVLLKYIYTNKIDICSLEEASGLYYCANKFMLPHLQQQCRESLFKLSNVSSYACQVYEYAELFEENKIKERATEIISKDTKLILKDPTFNEIQLSTLLYIFSLDKLNIDSELELLEAAVRYNEAQDKLTTQNQTLDKTDLPVQRAVEKIRFLTLTPKQFAESRIKTCLLTETEVLGIAMNIASSNTEISYPSRLCKNRNPRQNYYIDIILISLTIKDFKSTVSSSYNSTNPLDFSWWISVERYLHPEEKKIYLAAFVNCGRTNAKSSNWKCDSEYEVRLLSQNTEQNICINNEAEFTNEDYYWGANTVPGWEDVLDPSKGFLKDGAVTVEVLIKIIDCHT